MKAQLEQRVWWEYLKNDMRELLKESVILYEASLIWEQKYHDYSFVIFPAAKAYEGFLKTLFLDMGFITEEDFYGKYFRIGKALNPSLDKRFREESVYDKLVEFCQGKELPNRMWDMWKRGRNTAFHWFPNEKNSISQEEAGEILIQLFDTMDLIFKGCRIDKGQESKR